MEVTYQKQFHKQDKLKYHKDKIETRFVYTLNILHEDLTLTFVQSECLCTRVYQGLAFFVSAE